LNLSKYKEELSKEELKNALFKKDEDYYIVIDEIYNDLYKIKTNKRRIISYKDAYIDSKGELKNIIQTQVQTENYKGWEIDDIIELERLTKKSTEQFGYGLLVAEFNKLK
jgi:hypothetical protein